MPTRLTFDSLLPPADISISFPPPSLAVKGVTLTKELPREGVLFLILKQRRLKEIENSFHKLADIQTLDFQHPSRTASKFRHLEIKSPCWSWWTGVTKLLVQGEKMVLWAQGKDNYGNHFDSSFVFLCI